MSTFYLYRMDRLFASKIDGIERISLYRRNALDISFSVVKFFTGVYVGLNWGSDLRLNHG